MDIDKWYDKTIVIYRPKVISGYKQTTISTGTVECHIQRIQDTDSLAVYGLQGVAYRGYCDISVNVKEGDTVQDNLGNRYSVVAVNYLETDFTMNDHKEIIMTEYHARVQN